MEIRMSDHFDFDNWGPEMMEDVCAEIHHFIRKAAAENCTEMKMTIVFDREYTYRSKFISYDHHRFVDQLREDEDADVVTDVIIEARSRRM
jgi:hypothetical protein